MNFYAVAAEIVSSRRCGGPRFWNARRGLRFYAFRFV